MWTTTGAITAAAEPRTLPKRTAEDDGGGAQGARCRTSGGASAPPPEAYLNGKPSKNLQYTIGCLDVSTGHTTALSPLPRRPLRPLGNSHLSSDSRNPSVPPVLAAAALPEEHGRHEHVAVVSAGTR